MDVSVATAAVTVAVGLTVGAAAALLGIGGGIVLVPFLVLAFDLAQQTAEGTSLAVIVPTALAGTAVNLRSGLVSGRTLMLLAAGGIAGAYAGARLALALPAVRLEDVFGVVLVVLGARMAAGGWAGVAARRAVRRGRGPG